VWFCPWIASSHRRVSAVVWTYQDAAVAAAYRVDAQRWSELFGELMDTIEARFARPEPRRRVRDFVAGLLAPLPVKNCWTIAEHAGDDGPGGMQDLIGRASWDDGRSPRRCACFRHGPPRTPGRDTRSRRNRRPEEGYPHRRRPTAVLRYRRKDRELPARRASLVCLAPRAHPARRRSLPAQILVRRPGATG
jgi:hypothetical protein